MSEWVNINLSEVAPLYEVIGMDSPEPEDLYTQRYTREYTELSQPELEDPVRYFNELLSDLDLDSTLLIFGSGHSYNVNKIYDNNKFSKIVAVDFVKAAKKGLHREIGFYDTNILEKDLPLVSDYIFSSHTLEHFYKHELFDVVLPRLLKAARKAVIVLVPYADNWAGEPNHKCRFYENDEFAAKAIKYKIIRNGVEIAYWFEGGLN